MNKVFENHKLWIECQVCWHWHVKDYPCYGIRHPNPPAGRVIHSIYMPLESNVEALRYADNYMHKLDSIPREIK